MDQPTPGSTQPDGAHQQISIAAIKAGQNFNLAVASGLGAAIGGALLWAIITILTKMELGIVAIAVGFGVGRTIRMVGKGIDQAFGYLGAACALLGCVLGNFLSSVAFYAQARGISYFQALSDLDFDLLQRLATTFFHPMDLLFYGIAIYEGYRFSFKYKAR
jgi:hypothetical protein